MRLRNCRLSFFAVMSFLVAITGRDVFFQAWSCPVSTLKSVRQWTDVILRIVVF